MQIKLISLNLWNGGKLFAQVVEFLKTQKAEIMLFQEVYNGTSPKLEKRFQTLRQLSQLFPTYNYHFAPMYLDRRKKEGPLENGQLILTKFPLTQPAIIHFDIPYGKYDHDNATDFTHFPAGVQTAQIIIENKKVKILNVHGPVNFNGTLNTPRRLKMQAIILQEITQQSRVILGGDFNLRPQTQMIARIEKTLTNVFKNQLTTTFNLKRKNLKLHPGYADSVVDMLFLSSNFQIINQACPQVDVSDHLPLVATLVI